MNHIIGFLHWHNEICHPPLYISIFTIKTEDKKLVIGKVVKKAADFIVHEIRLIIITIIGFKGYMSLLRLVLCPIGAVCESIGLRLNSNIRETC